jgi:hypothetical protein
MRTRTQEQQEETSPSHRQAKTLGASHGFLLLLLSWVKDNLVFLFLKLLKKIIDACGRLKKIKFILLFYDRHLMF